MTSRMPSASMTSGMSFSHAAAMILFAVSHIVGSRPRPGPTTSADILSSHGSIFSMASVTSSAS